MGARRSGLLAVCGSLIFVTGVSCGPDVPDLLCPAGTERQGAKPPKGLKEQCVDPEKRGPRGLPYKEGPTRRWWPSGRVRSLGQFSANAPHGEFKWWYNNGNLSAVGRYHKGRKVGPWKEWAYKGTLTSMTPYKDGRIHGERVFYAPDGRVQQTYRYRGGRLLDKKGVRPR